MSSDKPDIASSSEQKTTTAWPRIGLFGGTFDPIHLGHTQPVIHLAEQLQLDKVHLLLANIPPHKPQPKTTTEQRTEMVKRVCAEQPLFQFDDRELNRQGKSYTIKSIKELKHEYPHASIYFFIGTDSLLTLPSWYKIEELLQLCHFVVSMRPGYLQQNLTEHALKSHFTTNLKQLLTKKSGKILLAQTPQVDISSTEIRNKINQGIDCDDFLNKNVLSFIKQHGLYRQ